MKKLLRKRSMLLVALLVGLCMPAMAQRYYTFNAVSLNVDGLPTQLGIIQINPDGSGATGAKKLAACLINENWDIIGLQEDFNYHNDFYTGAITGYYDQGSWGGHVTSLDGLLQTDGLGLLTAKKGNYLSLANETKVRWDVSDGSIGDGSAGQFDELIRKGFRYYEVAFAPGIIVDVYTLHMDAGDRQEDITAREAQLKQLANFVIEKSKANKRPAIIMGDTNCRYTRENLKRDFIDYINNNSDKLLTIKDGWIESVYDGVYPKCPSDALMTHTYGYRMGEVVDKIFYVNYNYPSGYSEKKLRLQANSYRLGVEYELDHNPVIINFTLIDETTGLSALTPQEVKSKWTATELAVSEIVAFGREVQDEQSYFLKNLATGTYLKSGGKWGTQTVLGSAGMPIKFVPAGDGKYKLQTTLKEFDPDSRTEDTDAYINANDTYIVDGDKKVVFMNRPSDEGSWTLVKKGDENSGYCYTLVNEMGLALSASNTIVSGAAINDADDNQKWVLLTEGDIRSQMLMATTSTPYDITPLLKGADFDLDNDKINTTKTWGPQFSNYSIGGGYNNDNGYYNYCAVTTASWNAEVKISQEITNLPAGNYELKGKGFYRVTRDKLFGGIEDYNMTVNVKIGDKTSSLAKNNSTEISKGSGEAAAILYNDNDSYSFSLTPSLTANGSLTVSVEKPALSFGWLEDKPDDSWVCIDDFTLWYRGDGSDADVADPYAYFKNIVIKKMNETYQKVLKLNAAGQNAYDISVVVYRLANNMVTSRNIANILCDMIDEAYANAVAAHQAAITITPGADVTGIIINPSFEDGKLGWTNSSFGNVVVTPNKTAPDESNYYEAPDNSKIIEQSLMNLKNGLYELKAYVRSEGEGTVYLVGNSYHKGFVTNDNFQEKTLLFLVEDRTATIGLMGGVGTNNRYYYPGKSTSFKADYFRLKYISDVPTGRVRLAIDDATNVSSAFDDYAKNSAEYTALTNALTANGSKTFTSGQVADAVEDIYTKLQAAAKKQKTRDADMTWAIMNPNFELDGNYPGWTTVGQVTGYETKVALQENLTYAYVGVDGRKLYNTWDNPSTGVVGFGLTQTVKGLPTGSYKLSAMVASGTGESITLTANDVSTTVAAGADQNVGVHVEVECKVEKGGDLEISVAGANNAWFKADDFRLTFIGHAVELKQDKTIGDLNDWYTDVYLTRPVKSGVWNSFVVPFDMKKPLTWDVRALTGIEMDGDHLSLKFSRIEENNEGEYVMAANTPYMVRYYPQITSGDVHDVLDRNVNVNADDDTSNDDPQTAQSFTSEGYDEGVIYTEYVTVNAKDKNSDSFIGATATDSRNKGTLDFMGSYLEEYTIPSGSVFIKDNKFYISQNANKIRGYRAYFTPNGAAAQARTFGMRSGEDTGIESEDNTDVTVVGIYNLNGMPLTEMQSGVNILKMSDGSIMKIIME